MSEETTKRDHWTVELAQLILSREGLLGLLFAVLVCATVYERLAYAERRTKASERSADAAESMARTNADDQKVIEKWADGLEKQASTLARLVEEMSRRRCDETPIDESQS